MIMSPPPKGEGHQNPKGEKEEMHDTHRAEKGGWGMVDIFFTKNEKCNAVLASEKRHRCDFLPNRANF